MEDIKESQKSGHLSLSAQETKFLRNVRTPEISVKTSSNPTNRLRILLSSPRSREVSGGGKFPPPEGVEGKSYWGAGSGF